jgi:hypothetical protein
MARRFTGEDVRQMIAEAVAKAVAPLHARMWRRARKGP